MTSRELEKQRLVSQMADMLCDRGLGPTALIGLETGRPLAFLVGQLLWVLQPAMGLVIPRERLAQFAIILEDPKALNQLIGHLSDRNEAEVRQS
jgi:hypothetical protein